VLNADMVCFWLLVWAREHDCEWDDWKCANAVKGGPLAVLRWARTHNCDMRAH